MEKLRVFNTEQLNLVGLTAKATNTLLKYKLDRDGSCILVVIYRSKPFKCFNHFTQFDFEMMKEELLDNYELGINSEWMY